MPKNNFTRLSTYCLFHCVFLACLYYGSFKGVEGAENVALFIAWFTIITSWFLLTEDGIDVVRKNPPIIPAAIDVPLDIIVVGVLVWAGALITGIFFALHIFILLLARDKAKEPKEGTTPDTKESHESIDES